ncbi:hypothetical protein CHUAL_005535 [Chamberlinius hualienensis]
MKSIMYIITLVLLATLVTAEENHDVLLCRQCGYDVVEPGHLANIKSPFAIGIRNDTIAGMPNVLVQLVQTTEGDLFEIVTTLHADALVTGDWFEDNSWYPDYFWKIGICPHCGEQLGWVFTRDEFEEDEHQIFMALMTHRFISRDLAESLLVVPNLYRT